MDLQDFKNHLSTDLYGMTREEGIKQGICIDCREEALPKCCSEAGRREFTISGLCEICWDRTIGVG